MNITLFGATGDLGNECLKQLLAKNHHVTVLVRNVGKLPAEYRDKIEIVEGNALEAEDLSKALPITTDAILFAIGVDKHSPEDLCTTVTRHLLTMMPTRNIDRLIWCGGGSTLLEEDTHGFGERFVQWFSQIFLSLRHNDKQHQYELLKEHRDLKWVGIRPLQMLPGKLTGVYRLGYHRFSGTSKITFADCAHAMVQMLETDEWLWKAPIVQY